VVNSNPQQRNGARATAKRELLKLIYGATTTRKHTITITKAFYLWMNEQASNNNSTRATSYKLWRKGKLRHMKSNQERILLREAMIYVIALKRERKWKHSTTKCRFLLLTGALARTRDRFFVFPPCVKDFLKALDKGIARERTAKPVLSETQFRTVVNGLKTELRAYAEAAWMTTARVGNLRGIRTKAWNYQTRKWTFYYNSHKTEARVPSGNITLSVPSTLEFLAQHLQRHQLRNSSAPFSEKKVTAIRSGLKKMSVGLHAFRRGGITKLLNDGVPPWLVCKLTLHTSEKSLFLYATTERDTLRQEMPADQKKPNRF